ncbi:MAG: hypothetical protein ACD_79C00963G0003 [uncultured bacterium]|nr:MAG: hypothetical protein ACD_79C00963G0003 [uncultured bacterium]
MNAPVNYLIKTLNEEVQHARQLLGFLFEKEKIIINNNIAELKQMMLKEHEFFVKSRELESARISLVDIISKRYEIKSEKVNLKMIIEKADKETSLKLNELRNAFLNLFGKIKNQNRKCEILIKKSLEIVNYSLTLFTESMHKKVKKLYNRNLKIENKYSSNSLLDKRG